MISDIFDSIPELYEAINDVKTHASDNNSSIFNNLKTNKLSLRQINETLMCFEKGLITMKTSNNENSFGNKINEQSTIIKELSGKYSKCNIDDILETRIKQAINIISTSQLGENELSALLYDHKEAFASDKEPLGAIIGHEADIILNIVRPYPSLSRRPAYPAIPKSRAALEIHTKELLNLGVIEKFGHNEEVERTTAVIVAWHN
ncbi:hypothetical protein O181_038083 [Austropuccinia psidii MF-1]|uniref:Uncharacterized protein n=1 Tax=Austropuccinia psidii MF-1 TaxID=1389203 RepID=A0A9Q3HAQ0_9BASI|nr:hypothetical protein [Austropuccinia psidii MF-1]